MTKLDRVEMIRANIGTGVVPVANKRNETIQVAKEKKFVASDSFRTRNKLSAIRDKLQELRDNRSYDEGREEREVSKFYAEEASTECREDAPVGCEYRYGLKRDQEEEIIIEAEFETVLEEGIILTARETKNEDDINSESGSGNGSGENEKEVSAAASMESSESSTVMLTTQASKDKQELKTQPHGENNGTESPISVDEKETEPELGGIEVEYGIFNPYDSSCNESGAADNEGGLDKSNTTPPSENSDNTSSVQVDAVVTSTKDDDNDDSRSKVQNGSEFTQNVMQQKVESNQCSIEHDQKVIDINDNQQSDLCSREKEDTVHPHQDDPITLDATWSFDTTLKRKKSKKKKAKADKANNSFAGFNEGDEKDTPLCADKNDRPSPKTISSKNESATTIDEAIDEEKAPYSAIENELIKKDIDVEEDTVAVETNQNISASEESMELPYSTIENKLIKRDADVEEDTVAVETTNQNISASETESIELPYSTIENKLIKKDADVEEDTVAIETNQNISASESMEFDTILGCVADYIEKRDWVAFISAITSRPSLATLSSADFFPSEFSGFLAVGANKSVLLHEVCKNTPSVDAIKVLLEVHEAAVRTPGQWGYLPIHCACASGASEAVIKELIAVNPESAQQFGDDNMFSLHLACKRGTSAGTIKLLLTAYPYACIAKDVYDKTPMDYILSLPDGANKLLLLEIIGLQIQSMCMSKAEIEEKLRQIEEKSSYMEIELSEKQRRMIVLENELEKIKVKSVSIDEELKEKQERMMSLGESLKENQEKITILEEELGEERSKASVFCDNLKNEFTKSCLLERKLKEEQAKTTALQLELKTNCQEWNALGIEMEDEFKKSSMELNKERKEVASLEKKLCEEREKSLLLEGQLKNQCDKSHSLDTSLKNERQKLCNFEKEFVDAKERWLMEKQDIHETNDKHLAEAQQIINEGKEVTRLQKECWLVERQEIYEKTDTQMVDAYKLVDEIERALKEKHVQSLIDKQELYSKSEYQLVEAYKVLCSMEKDSEEDRTKWLLERQNIYERNEIVLEEAFTIIKEKELELTLKQNEQKKYGVVLEERRELLEKECQKSKSLILQLELIKAARGGISRGIEDDLALQKRLGESQAMQIKALESSIELKIATDSEIAKEQHKRLVFEKSLTDQIMDKIQEKQRLLDENEAVIVTLEKSKVMKQELIESQQRKVEALEIGRREKEEQLNLNNEAKKRLDRSIAEKTALEKEEVVLALKLGGTRAARKAAIDIEEDQIKELDYILARKQALIELEKMKEKTLQQTIAHKHELIDSEVTRIKELELLIAEKQMLLTSERNSTQALNAAKAEKVSILASERDVVSDLRRTQEEKEKILEAKKKTEELIQSRIVENEILLASKKAAIEEVEAAQDEINTQLEIQKSTVAEVENQIARKKSLIPKEEYVAKCLQELVLRRGKIMPPGPFSYFANATYGMKFLLKETFLATNYVKTQIREESASNRQRKDNIVVRIPGLDACKSIVYAPKLLVSGFIRKFGVNIKSAAPKSISNDNTSSTKSASADHYSRRIPKWNNESS